MKKIASLVGAGALLVGMTFPVLGWWHSSDDVTIGNWAVVKNDLTTKAYSGDNDIGGKCVWGGSIMTGIAGSFAGVSNDVNSSVVGCDGCGDVSIGNWAVVRSELYTKADTGDNDLHGKYVGGGLIRTGAAGATSLVDNIVNFSLVGGVI
jgi:hypothetical protein